MCLDAGLKLVRWKTANGSLIVQEYLEPLTDRVETYAMGGSTYWRPIVNTKGERTAGSCRITFQAGYSDEIKESKTETALAANWTHSQDAVIVQDTVHDWEGNYFAVHDCFYGPAGTMKEMTAKARKSFHNTRACFQLVLVLDRNFDINTGAHLRFDIRTNVSTLKLKRPILLECMYAQCTCWNIFPNT